MLYNLHFFSSKCRLFHKATLFGFCITHILNTGCAKIWKKVRRQTVKCHIFIKQKQPLHIVQYLNRKQMVRSEIERLKVKGYGFNVLLVYI